MAEITVVGGGIAGLVAAITCAEEGASVRLHEAHAALGGKARSSPGPHVANEGPHVLYADGAFWSWLRERGLPGRAPAQPLSALRSFWFRRHGTLRRRPPLSLVRLAADHSRVAPVDQDFHSWIAGIYGDTAADELSSAMGVATFDADPGRLSAAFVHERFRRVFSHLTPQARYVRGGWTALVDSLAARSAELGVIVETGARVDRLPEPPVILAVPLPAARQLLADPTLDWESGSTLLLDIAVERRRGDAFAVSDLDEAGWLERFSVPDPTLAPEGQSLVQAHMPLRPGERTEDCLERLKALTELGVPGWEDRLCWQRRAAARGRTGALDLPGRTWRDRPAVDRGDGVFLAGDMVAAPGLLSEVSYASGIVAARGALATVGARRVRSHRE